MKGNLYIIIGAKGQGKSTITKKMIEGKPQHIFDVNNEYTDLTEDWEQSDKSRCIDMDIKNFVFLCQEKHINNRYIVVEDATGFFRGNVSSSTIQMLQGSRHQKNNYILLFHSIRSVPKQLFDFCNVVVLYKTNDVQEEVKKKYPMLYAAHCRVMKNPKYKPVIIKINEI
jgi:hypothetical protein